MRALARWLWSLLGASFVGGCATLGASTDWELAVALDAPTVAGRALALELEGRDREAIESWLQRPADRWSASRLAGLFERVAATDADIRRLAAGGAAWRTLAADLAEEAGDEGLATRSRAEAGGFEQAERCDPPVALAALRSAYHDADGWPVVGDPARTCATVPTHGGHLDGPAAGGLVMWRLPGQAAASCAVIIGTMPWRLSAGGRVLATHASDRHMTPTVARIAVASGSGPWSLEVHHSVGGRGPRVFMAAPEACEPSPPPPERALAALAAFDVALGDGDLAWAQDLSTALAGMPSDLVTHAQVRLALADRGTSALAAARMVLATLPQARPDEPVALRRARAAALLQNSEAEQARPIVDTLSARLPDAPDVALMRAMLARDDGAMSDALAVAGPFLGHGMGPRRPATCRQRLELFDVVAGGFWTGDLDPRRALAAGAPRNRDCRALNVVVADVLVSQGRFEAARAVLAAAADAANEGDHRAVCERLASLTKRQGLPSAPACPQRGIPDNVSTTLSGSTSAANKLPPLADVRRHLETASASPLSDYAEIVWKERIDTPHSEGDIVSRHHRLMCLHDPDATTRLGEFPLSPASTLVLARTWKVHRHTHRVVLQPIDFDHDTGVADVVSLPGLEPGDCAEIVWLERHPAPPGVAPGFITPPYHLDDPAGPTRAARWVLRFAPQAAAEVRVEAFGPGSERLQQQRMADQVVISASMLPTAVDEPGDPRPDRRRATVLAHAAVDPARRIRTVANDVATAARPSLESRAFAAARRGEPADAVVRAVARLIEDEPDARLDGTPLADAHVFGRGSRALVVWAAMRALALPAALVLARPLSEAGPGARDDEFDAWSWPLLLFGDAIDRVVVDTRSASHRPPPILGNVEALVVASTLPDLPVGARVRTPVVDPGRRVGHVELVFMPDGGRVEGRGEETLHGTFATAWRDVIQRIPVENRGRLMTHVAETWFPRLTTFEHALDGVGHEDAALRWTWRVGGDATQLSAERFEMLVRMAPDDPLGAMGGLAERRHPLFFNMIARHEHTLVVAWPEGWHAVSLPGDVAIEAGGFWYQRKVRVAPDGRSVRVVRTWRTDPRWVEPAEFPLVRETAARIGQADTVRFDLVHGRLLGSEQPGPMHPKILP